MSDYTLHHGDCLDILPMLEPQSVDAIICDPPYGTTACKWDSVIPFDPMWQEIKRVLRPRGACVLFGAQPFTSALVMSNVGWFRYEWVWEKSVAGNPLQSGHRPLAKHENILIFGCGDPLYYPQMDTGTPYMDTARQSGGRAMNAHRRVKKEIVNLGTRVPGSVRRFSNPNNNTRHPTQKPLALLEYLVRTYTNEGDVVLDFTMGSGTTGHACGNLGRRFVGIERDAAYFAIAEERIATAYAPLRMMQVAG